MQERARANINPQLLVWARQTAGYSIQEAAHKIGITPQRLHEWETGDEKPTLRQLRLAAKLYRRPSALFYASTVPPNPPTITDFRLLPDVDLKYTPTLLYEIRRAFQRREIALELTTQLEEIPRKFPLESDMAEQPNRLASRIRAALGVDLNDQFSWQDHYTALNAWISAIENLGVLVFQVRNVELVYMRGFSISERPLPVIGINGKDSPRGRIFTLLHELVHVIFQSGGICNLLELESESFDSLEPYCNRIAGEVLVPVHALLAEDVIINNAGNQHWEDWQIQQLANRFMVSQEVILRRLLTLGKTTTSYYQYKRGQYKHFYKREKANKGFVPYFRLVLRDNGPTFTSLVLSAYYSDIISSRDLSNFLGGIKLKHIEPIEHALIGNEGGTNL